MANLHLCPVTEEAAQKIEKMRYRKEKTLSALVFKINKDKLVIEVEEEWEDTTIEEIADEIPPQQPRYIVINYPLKHDDGRISYPLLFIFLSPQGSSPPLQMMYAGSKLQFVNSSGFTKALELRSLDDFTDENVQAALK